MYTLSQMVELAKIQASEWGNYGDRGLIPIANEINMVMMGKDIDHAVVVDESTGMPPFLETTAETQQYDCPSNCRKVASVFYEAEDASDTYDEYGAYQTTVWRGKRFYIKPTTSRRYIDPNRLATVTFRTDPGTTTEKYYLKYYLLPTTLLTTNGNTEPDVPWEFRGLMLDGIIARIKPMQYGDESPWLTWLQRLEAEFWGELNYNPPENNLMRSRPC